MALILPLLCSEDRSFSILSKSRPGYVGLAMQHSYGEKYSTQLHKVLDRMSAHLAALYYAITIA